MMLDNDKYKYTFNYVYNDIEVNYSFNAEVNLEEIVDNFKQFLLATSWLPSAIDRIQIVEDEVLEDE